MAAAAPERRRQPAGERLEERVRARVVAAGSEVEVGVAQDVRERAGVQRADRPDVLEPGRQSPDEGELEALVVGVPVEPGEDVRALARVVRPARRHDARPSAVGSGSRLAGGWKTAGSTALWITVGERSSSPSSPCRSRLQRDWKTVASASAWLTLSIRRSVPSSQPR